MGPLAKHVGEGHNSQQRAAAVSAGEPKSISTCYWQPGAGLSDHRMSHDSENTSAAPLFPPVQRLIARPSSSGIRPRRGPSSDWPRSRLWFRVPYRSGQAPTNGPPTYTAYAGERSVEIRPMSGINYRLKSATDWQMPFLWQHASNFPQYGKPSTQITCTRCGNANYICAPYHMTTLPVKRIRLQSS